MSSPQDGRWRLLIRVTLISIFFLSPSILLIRWQIRRSAFQNLLQTISTSISTSNVSSKPAASNHPPHSPNSSTCLSRWQQDDFFPSRKSFTPDLKSPLSTAFAEYEKMHSSCYHHHGKQLSKAITSPDRNDPCKYLVFLQDGKFGLGNYILSLLSAFVYALLTNRMLLVDARYNLPDLFCEPFTNSSWLLPPQFPYQNLLQAPFLDDKLEEKLKYINSVHLMLLNEQTQGEQRFFCSQTQGLLDKVLWIGWSSNQYYVPRFFTFPQFWRPLTNLFPDVSTVFTQLSRRLVLPHNHVWEKIMKVFSRERLNGHYGVIAFILANSLSSSVFLFLISLVFSAISYNLVQLHSGFGHFMYFVLNLFAALEVAESLMMIIASLVPNFLMGVITGAGIQGLFLLVAGFFRLPEEMPKVFWKYPLSYISFHSYALEGFYVNDFIGLEFDQRIPGLPKRLGKSILEDDYQITVGRSKWWNLAVLFLMVIFYRVLFLLLVKVGERRRIRKMERKPNTNIRKLGIASNDK